jgi:hypothetical protein
MTRASANVSTSELRNALVRIASPERVRVPLSIETRSSVTSAALQVARRRGRPQHFDSSHRAIAPGLSANRKLYAVHNLDHDYTSK